MGRTNWRWYPGHFGRCFWHARGAGVRLKEIAALKKKYNFRFFVDDAHGFGTLGATGAGAGEEQGVQDDIDVYFATFAKSMASTGAFIAGDKEIMDYLKYNLRSQMFAKSLQMQLVVGALKAPGYACVQ